MILADTLSRAYTNDNDANSDNLEEDLVCAVNLIVDNLPVSDPKLQQIREVTEHDVTMTILRSTIKSGWPEKRSQVPQELREFWNYRDELSEASGIIFKGEKIVIPQSLRKDMLKIIHASHFGIVKCKQRARGILFWFKRGRILKKWYPSVRFA